MNLLIQWLLQHLLLCGVAFAAGPSSLIEAPSPDGGVIEETQEPEETTVEEDSEGTGEETEEGVEEEGDGTPPPAPKSEAKVDWKIVPKEVRGHLQEIQKTNPKLANLLQNAVYTSQTFLKTFPNGLKEAQALKTSVEDLGGLDEVKNIHQTYRTLQDEQESLDNLARSGDPQVLDNLMEIAGDGFNGLMPVALDRWAVKDAAGYSHAIGKVMVNALTEGNVVADLNLAVRMLNLKDGVGTAEGIDALKRVAEWVNKVGKVAATAPKRDEPDPRIKTEMDKLEGEKAKLFNNQFVSSFAPWRDEMINTEVRALAGTKSLNKYQVESIGDRVVKELAVILNGDSQYVKDLRKLYDSRDMGELQKFTRSRVGKLVPGVTKKIYNQMFSGPKLGSGKTKNTKTDDKTVKHTPEVKDEKGWTKISVEKAPPPDDIDNRATDFKMKFNKQAILKNGKKVYWGDKIPK